MTVRRPPVPVEQPRQQADEAGEQPQAAPDRRDIYRRYVNQMLHRNETVAKHGFAAYQKLILDGDDPVAAFRMSQDAGQVIQQSAKTMLMLINCGTKLAEPKDQ